jgi:hypothetical protein
LEVARREEDIVPLAGQDEDACYILAAARTVAAGGMRRYASAPDAAMHHTLRPRQCQRQLLDLQLKAFASLCRQAFLADRCFYLHPLQCGSEIARLRNTVVGSAVSADLDRVACAAQDWVLDCTCMDDGAAEREARSHRSAAEGGRRRQEKKS